MCFMEGREALSCKLDIQAWKGWLLHFSLEHWSVHNTYYVNFWVAKLVGFKWESIFLCWNIGQTNNELKVNNEIPCRQYFAFFTHFHLLYILFKLANLLYSGRRARS